MGNKPLKAPLVCVSENRRTQILNNDQAFYFLSSTRDLSNLPTAFRKVLYTSPHLLQLVKMDLLPNQSIGLEKHEDTDQFFLILKGRGLAQIGDMSFPIAANSLAIVPPNTLHNIINTSNSDIMELLTIYSPAEHQDGLVAKLKPQN